MNSPADLTSPDNGKMQGNLGGQELGRSMYFYTLPGEPGIRLLGELLETLVANGRRALAVFPSPQRAEIYSKRLWLARPDSFVPHGLSSDPFPAKQPVLFSSSVENLNGADALVLFAGGPLPATAPEFQMVFYFFNKNDPGAVLLARESWYAAKDHGFARRFFQNGRLSNEQDPARDRALKAVGKTRKTNDARPVNEKSKKATGWRRLV